MDRIHNAVLRQREEEATNFFSNPDDLREFIAARAPSAGVNITVKMCCFSAERLSADNGVRVTLISSTFHGVFEAIQKDLDELNSINRKPFLVQITVWDGKRKTGSPRTARMLFRQGAVYEFKQVHGVGFYSDIPKGSVQLDDAAPGRITERQPPLLKRKLSMETSGRHPKARALDLRDEEMKDGDSCDGDATLNAPRTRGKPSAK